LIVEGEALRVKGVIRKKILRILSSILYVLLLTLHPIVFAYTPGHFYTHGQTKEKLISLTFDDGPGPMTPRLLQILKDHQARATFFMEGTQVERYSSIVRQVRAAGQEIGNHTYDHFDYHKVKNAMPDRLTHELKQEEASLRRALREPEFHTHVVRMPYGYFNHSWLLPTLKKGGYCLVHWSYVHDAPTETPEQAAAQYVAHAKPGAIFLFHDGGRHREKMLNVVTAILNTLGPQGYRFVAAEDLLRNR